MSFYGGDIPWFKIGDLNDRWTRVPEQSITQLGLSQSSAKMVPANALLVAMYGSIGKLGLTSFPCATNQAIAFCIPDDAVSVEWLFYYLLGRRTHLISLGKGGTQQNISQTVLLQELAPIPPLEIQRRIIARIVELFAELDDGEAALGRASDDLETYRKSLLKAAVSGELTAEWRKANPAHETGEQLLQRILDNQKSGWEAVPGRKRRRYVQPSVGDQEHLADLPPEWTWVSMAQIVRETEYGTSIKCAVTPGGTPVLRMGDIRDGKLNFDRLKYAPPGASVPLLTDGDLLFNRTNSAELVGKAAVYHEELTPCSYASYLFAVRFNLVLPDYVCCYVNSIFGKAWVAANKSQQVGQANLSAGTLMRMPVPLPPLSEQAQIVAYVEQELIATEEAGQDLGRMRQSASSLRQSILTAAFRGELVQ